MPPHPPSPVPPSLTSPCLFLRSVFPPSPLFLPPYLPTYLPTSSLPPYLSIYLQGASWIKEEAVLAATASKGMGRDTEQVVTMGVAVAVAEQEEVRMAMVVK